MLRQMVGNLPPADSMNLGEVLTKPRNMERYYNPLYGGAIPPQSCFRSQLE